MQDIDITYENWNFVDVGSTRNISKNKPCASYRQPAHRPSWSPAPNSHAGDLSMVDVWWKRGFVVPATAETPDFTLVENEIGGGK